MKVIAVNGSPRPNGNTATALNIMADILGNEGVAVEIIQAGRESTRGCTACGQCATSPDHLCTLKTDPIVNESSLKMRAADGIILASPTYYAGIAGGMKSFLDRVFYSSSSFFRLKVGAAVGVTRRAGAMNTMQQLTSFLNLGEMVIAPSLYWTIAYGADKGEVVQDGEGVQTLEKCASNMAWLLKLIEAGKDSVPLPKKPGKRVRTNFIR